MLSPAAASVAPLRALRTLPSLQHSASVTASTSSTGSPACLAMALSTPGVKAHLLQAAINAPQTVACSNCNSDSGIEQLLDRLQAGPPQATSSSGAARDSIPNSGSAVQQLRDRLQATGRFPQPLTAMLVQAEFSRLEALAGCMSIPSGGAEQLVNRLQAGLLQAASNGPHTAACSSSIPSSSVQQLADRLLQAQLQTTSSATQPVQPTGDHASDPKPVKPADDQAGNTKPVKPAVDQAITDDEGEDDYINPATGEVDGPKGPEPTRYGDWERKGRVSDF